MLFPPRHPPYSFGQLKQRLGLTKLGAWARYPLQYLRRQSISQKITLGYGVTIGIAVLGACFGLFIGSTYEEQAARNRDIAVRKAELASHLTQKTLLLALQPQQLLTETDQSVWLRHKISQSQRDISALRTSTTGLETFIQDNIHIAGMGEGVEVVQPLRLFLDDYELWMESLWLSLRSAPVVSQDDASIAVEERLRSDRQAILTTELSAPRARELQSHLEELSEQLAHLGHTAELLEIRALEEFETARSLRFWVVTLSLICSTALAILCALYISRMIADPIRQVITQTHRITQEKEFGLRVHVNTEDEIAQLAGSIDQLVRWAGQYTQELEAAQANLEQRVDERTQALKIAQAQVVQSEKMSSLGQLVAGVAHEINNPVGFIYSNVSHATEYVCDLLDLIEVYRQESEETEAIPQKLEEVELPFLEEDVMKVLRSMKSGADRIKQIVLSLRTFSRLDEADLKFADLHEGLDSTLTLLSHRLHLGTENTTIEVVRDYGELPLVNCYPGQMNQVFMNLIANAIDALGDTIASGQPLSSARQGAVSGSVMHPKITITTRVVGDRCTITVGDNGAGIAAGVRDRIFDPFFTTKPIGKGTGMGLAISYQIIVDKHHGELHCDSQPGGGTLFLIDIPINVGIVATA